MTPRQSGAELTRAARARKPSCPKLNETRRAELLEIAASSIATAGLRASMHDIARAAGIKTGSLYHHFESKEALLIELLRSYHSDLDRLADAALTTLDDPAARPGYAQIVEFGTAIACCAVAHRAAIQISMYESPSANPELINWTQHRPANVLEAMYQTLRAARWANYLGPDIDLRVLADHICQMMLRVGLDVVRHNRSAEWVATLLCRIMLEGLAAGHPSEAGLNGSPAFLAVDRVIKSWGPSDDDSDDKTARIRAAARAEFGRRGYEGTTMRDIAAAAGVGHGSVSRLVGSKEELLASVVGALGEKTEQCAEEILRSKSTPVEKLDALSWVSINALHSFGDEFRIQLAWMRQIPPDTPNPSIEFPARLKQTTNLLGQGIRLGSISVSDVPREMLARCVMSLQWLPENIVSDIGPEASLKHARETLLNGVARPVGNRARRAASRRR